MAQQFKDLIYLGIKTLPFSDFGEDFPIAYSVTELENWIAPYYSSQPLMRDISVSHEDNDIATLILNKSDVSSASLTLLQSLSHIKVMRSGFSTPFYYWAKIKLISEHTIEFDLHLNIWLYELHYALATNQDWSGTPFIIQRHANYLSSDNSTIEYRPEANNITGMYNKEPDLEKLNTNYLNYESQYKQNNPLFGSNDIYYAFSNNFGTFTGEIPPEFGSGSYAKYRLTSAYVPSFLWLLSSNCSGQNVQDSILDPTVYATHATEIKSLKITSWTPILDFLYDNPYLNNISVISPEYILRNSEITYIPINKDQSTGADPYDPSAITFVTCGTSVKTYPPGKFSFPEIGSELSADIINNLEQLWSARTGGLRGSSIPSYFSETLNPSSGATIAYTEYGTYSPKSSIKEKDLMLVLVDDYNELSPLLINYNVSYNFLTEQTPTKFFPNFNLWNNISQFINAEPKLITHFKYNLVLNAQTHTFNFLDLVNNKWYTTDNNSFSFYFKHIITTNSDIRYFVPANAYYEGFGNYNDLIHTAEFINEFNVPTLSSSERSYMSSHINSWNTSLRQAQINVQQQKLNLGTGLFNNLTNIGTTSLALRSEYKANKPDKEAEDQHTQINPLLAGNLASNVVGLIGGAFSGANAIAQAKAQEQQVENIPADLANQPEKLASNMYSEYVSWVYSRNIFQKRDNNENMFPILTTLCPSINNLYRIFLHYHLYGTTFNQIEDYKLLSEDTQPRYLFNYIKCKKGYLLLKNGNMTYHHKRFINHLLFTGIRLWKIKNTKDNFGILNIFNKIIENK